MSSMTDCQSSKVGIERMRRVCFEVHKRGCTLVRHKDKTYHAITRPPPREVLFPRHGSDRYDSDAIEQYVLSGKFAAEVACYDEQNDVIELVIMMTQDLIDKQSVSTAERLKALNDAKKLNAFALPLAKAMLLHDQPDDKTKRAWSKLSKRLQAKVLAMADEHGLGEALSRATVARP
jgi:hypothetical protein